MSVHALTDENGFACFNNALSGLGAGNLVARFHPLPLWEQIVSTGEHLLKK